MKIDKSRFNFLRAQGPLLDKALQRVNMILEGVIDSKPYVLDWEHILSEYDKLGVGDVAEFSSSYTFAWHAMNQKLDNDASKQAMYLEIIDGIVERREGTI